MNPLFVEAIAALTPYARSFIEGFSVKPSDVDEPECTCPKWGNPSWPHRHDCPVEDTQDVEAIAEELREVKRERDDLRRQLRDIRTAHEALHRALYPGLAPMKWNLGK